MVTSARNQSGIESSVPARDWGTNAKAMPAASTISFMSRSMPIGSLIRTIPDFPRPGIQFRDITTLLANPVGFARAIGDLADRYRSGEREVDLVAGIEARGFIIGAALALALG